jgi:hypothetical protein
VREAAAVGPAYVIAQVGHPDPTLTLRIYQQLLKRRRREEYRERANGLLGMSRTATGSGYLGPSFDPTRYSCPADAGRVGARSR